MRINKQYTADGYVMFIDDGQILVGKAPIFEIVEVPIEFFDNEETREAIFRAYINLRDTYPVTVYRALREFASDKTIYWASELVGNDFWL